MAIINYMNTKATNKAALKKIISYVLQEEKTDERLVSGKDLMPENAYNEMILTKKEFNKLDRRQYLHLVQAFPPDEDIDYQTAHEVALKLADHYKGFQVLVATHKDKSHIHSHLIINSVNYETGRKFQQSFQQLNEVMDKSNEICKQYGLSVIEDRKSGKRISRNEYQIAMKGESWKMKLINTIDDVMKHTQTKNAFISAMNSHGYEVNWSKTRKYITYTTPEGLKCRCNKLHDEKYTKEALEHAYSGQNERGESRDNHNPTSGKNHSAERLGDVDECAIGRNYAEAAGNAGTDGCIYGSLNGGSTKAQGGIGESDFSVYPSDREDDRSEDARDQRQIPDDGKRQSGTKQEAGENETDHMGAGTGADGLLSIAHHLSQLMKDDNVQGPSKPNPKKSKGKKAHDSWEHER